MFKAVTIPKKGLFPKEVKGGYVYMKRFNKHFIVNQYTSNLQEVKMWEVDPQTLVQLEHL